jgi:hypothetical protein
VITPASDNTAGTNKMAARIPDSHLEALCFLDIR